MEFSNRITIDASPGAVFDYLARFENVPRWNYAIEETIMTSPGSIGVGSTYRQVRSIPSRSVESFEVTEFVPGRSLAIHGEFGPFVGTMRYALDGADGTTQLTNTAKLEGRGVLRLAAPVAAPGIREAVAANLGVLKRILESTAGDDPAPQ